MERTIIALAGLPASGKSAIALRLNKALDSVLLDKDRVRDLIFQQHVDYSHEQNDLCVRWMYQAALYLLSKDPSPVVIIDGRSYSKSAQIVALKDTVTKARCKLCLVECVCSAESAKRRLQQDQGIHPAKDRDYALYLRSRAEAEPINEPRLTLDTDSLSAEECCERVLAYLAVLQ